MEHAGNLDRAKLIKPGINWPRVINPYLNTFTKWNGLYSVARTELITPVLPDTDGDPILSLKGVYSNNRLDNTLRPPPNRSADP